MVQPFDQRLQEVIDLGVDIRWYMQEERLISIARPTQKELEAIESLGGTLVSKGRYTKVFRF